MKISRFIGATSREVMRQVREALGPDALIVSNRSVADGVEVMATLDEPAADAVPVPVPGPAPEPASISASAPALALPRPDEPPAWAPAEQPEAGAAGLEAAIGALRGALESRLDGLLWGGNDAPGREPLRAALFRLLLDAGFSARLARAMLERLPGTLAEREAQSWVRNELVTHLPVLAREDELWGQGGVYALVGPTGVGKTTTLAKLAARCVARVGRDQVAMLTTDNFRIGALEQLQIYGRLMGVPARSVRDVAELRATLAELGDRRIVLIDTTGISQRDRNVAAQAALLCGAGRPVRRLLVLNAASQGDTLDEVAHAYRHGAGEDVVGCIVTKLDEAARLGPALDTAIRHRLPVHYVCVGQKVPEDLTLARADELVDRALAAPERAPALYAPSEADMASLWRARAATQDDGAQRRRQWLAAALLPAGAAAAPSLPQALAWLDSDPACGQARATWRQAGMAGHVPAASSVSGLGCVQRAFPSACDRYLLALHGTALVDGAARSGTLLQAALLLSDRGAALGAVAGRLRQRAVASAQAWTQSGPGRTLAERAAVLAEGMPKVPMVHLVEPDDESPWRALPAGTAWLARCAGGTKVLHDDCPTTLNAVGKALGYLPAGRLDAPAGVAALRTGQADAAALDLWASGTEISVPRRGAPALALRLVCARVASSDGTVLRQLFGLTSLSASQADAAAVARWLVLQERARRTFRDMAQAWPALPADGGAAGLAGRAALAAQLGAACWQLAHAPGAAALESSLRGALGQGRKLTARAVPAALLKIFSMLEMAA
ncbi:flagellar biosynthesis protein FlhF [Bordetella sp. BOR01]|uniref:flagellar biosynthesis protein FlhF n=1 Tax=Bordetella sp. BOR01 TaxID=2854779 RepID=UPI001C48D616|nr:flagellar biosynthesis protein FlhF [Bordetella sp. BOR01]MBV7487071.1 flagellar biosynthesis protein FlhF [Bordetella sp. BOR01]